MIFIQPLALVLMEDTKMADTKKYMNIPMEEKLYSRNFCKKKTNMKVSLSISYYHLIPFTTVPF